MTIHEKLDILLENIGNNNKFNLRIDFSISGSINTYDRGATWSFSVGTLSIYLINGLPTSTSFAGSGSSSLIAAHSGYQNGTVSINLSIKNMYTIDSNKNIIEQIY